MHIITKPHQTTTTEQLSTSEQPKPHKINTVLVALILHL